MDISEISVIAIDLDGTLLRSDSTLSDRSIKAIEQCVIQGLHIVIATARPFLSAKQRLSKVRTSKLYYICSNGAAIYQEDQPIYIDSIDAIVAQECIDIFYSHELDFVISVEVACTGNLYTNRKDNPDDSLFEVIDLRSIQDDLSKLFVHIPKQHKGSLPPFPKECRVDIWDNGQSANVTSPTANKLSAMSKLLVHLDLSYNNLMTLGDGVNDIDLLEASHIGVAMENAAPEAKVHSRFTTSSNDEDGVAIVLEKILAKGGL